MGKVREEPKSSEFVDSDDSGQMEKRLDIDNNEKEAFDDRIEEEDCSTSIPYAAIAKAPVRLSRHFKVTIFPKCYNIELKRESFFDNLLARFKNLEIIVSKEDSPVVLKFRSNFIIKIYLDFTGTSEKVMRTSDLYYIINDILRSVVGSEKLYSEEQQLDISDIEKRPEIVIEKVISKKHAIIWATLDHSPRFTPNFDPLVEFSEMNRIYNWAVSKKDSKFSYTDPFVHRSRNLRFLKCFKEEFDMKHHVLFQLKPVQIGPFMDWRDEVISWFNGWLRDGWFHKRQQLYLVSKPNCGKTVFIREVIFRQGRHDAVPSEAILIPERDSKFAWHKSNPIYHSVVFCDEYDPKHYNIELLKIILQGDSFSPAKKHVNSADDICLRIPMIFISNKPIPSTCEYVGLKERFHIVSIPDSAKTYNPINESPYKKYFDEHDKQILEQAFLETDQIEKYLFEFFSLFS